MPPPPQTPVASSKITLKLVSSKTQQQPAAPTARTAVSSGSSRNRIMPHSDTYETKEDYADAADMSNTADPTATHPAYIANSSHNNNTTASSAASPTTNNDDNTTKPTSSLTTGDAADHLPAAEKPKDDVAAAKAQAEEIIEAREAHDHQNERWIDRQTRKVKQTYKKLTTKKRRLPPGQLIEINLNDSAYNTKQHKGTSNVIVTSKYTLLTFFPINMFEQFRRLANSYFLLIVLLNLIPQVSPFPIYTNLAPLIVVLVLGECDTPTTLLQ